jgi:transposase
MITEVSLDNVVSYVDNMAIVYSESIGDKMAFVRVVETKSSTGEIQRYVRVVENRRQKGKSVQRVVANLGNVKVLRRDIKKIINGLLRAVGERAMVFVEDCSAVATEEFGVRYVVEVLWKQLELDGVIRGQMGSGRVELDYERWIRMMVVNKVSEPRSKLGIFEWLRGVWWPGHGFDDRVVCEAIEPRAHLVVCKREVMKFYRAMDHLLGMKEAVERHLYFRLRDLLSLRVDLVFYDVTSSYFEGEGPEGFATLGYSRDREPGKNQVVIGLIMCNGLPIGHEVFEGNRLDKKTVKQVLSKLRQQFDIHRCIFVGDRGLVSAENLEELEHNGFDSILALKKRRNRQVKDLLLGRGPLILCRESEDLEWREVIGGDGIRYIVCRNPVVAGEQKRRREKDLMQLESQLRLLKQKVDGMRRPAIKTVVKQAEEILSHKHGRRLLDYRVNERSRKLDFYRKQEAMGLEEALDGVYILRTKHGELTPLRIIHGYKELCDVERAFRTMKSVLDLRPFYHHLEPRVRAHAFICFLAYLIEKYVEQALKRAEVGMSAEKAFQSLKNMGVAVMKVGHQHYGYVTEPTAWQRRILKTLGIKIPPRILIEQG